MPNFHPFLVHFPVALLTLSLLMEIAAVLRRAEELSRVGWWCQLWGTLGLAAGVATGLLAEKSIHVAPIVRPFIDRHKEFAFISMALFAALLLWRAGARGKLPPGYAGLFILLYAGGILVLWAGAWYGGEMVYRFGLGVTTGRLL